MRRILVDLRVFLATVTVLGVALAILGLAFLGIYNAPIEHVVNFQGEVSVRVANHSTIVGLQNYTETGVPLGALLGFSWNTGFGGVVSIFAYNGTDMSVSTAAGCAEGPAWFGSCAWTAAGPSFTVSVTYVNCPSPICSANFTAAVGVQGWYSYSTPAR